MEKLQQAFHTSVVAGNLVDAAEVCLTQGVWLCAARQCQIPFLLAPVDDARCINATGARLMAAGFHNVKFDTSCVTQHLFGQSGGDGAADERLLQRA